MDDFVLGCLLLVFTAFVEAILTGTITARGHHGLAQRIDLHARWAAPVAFVLLAGWSFGPGLLSA